MSYIALMQKAQDAFLKAKAINDEFSDKPDGMPAEKRTEFEAYMKESKDFKARAEEAKELDDQAAFFEKAAPRVPIGGGGGERKAGGGEGERKNTDGGTIFADLGEQLKAVIHADRKGGSPDPRLLQVQQKAATGHNEQIASDGGWLLEDTFATELLRLVMATGILSKRARSFEIGPNSTAMVWRGIKESARTDGNRHGGIRVYRTTEAEAATASQIKFNRRRIEVDKLSALTYLTEEQMQDTVMLASLVRELMPDAFNYKLDNEMLRGSGTDGACLGVLNAPCLVTISAETGQDGTTIIAENLEKMYARMLPSSLANAVWNMNMDCWPQIFQLHHVMGTTGVPLYIPPNGIKEAPFGMLLGRPVEPIEQASTLGTVGDIIFADWRQYALVRKGGLKATSSIHVKFVEGEEAFRFTLRVSGAPMPESAITPANGSNTQSPFIALATRAA